MPLLDHFHSPLKDRRHWESIHGLWAASLVDALNSDLLPREYFAEFQVHLGSRVEVDVGTFQERNGPSAASSAGSANVAVKTWSPPTPTGVIPVCFADEFEVQVFCTTTGATLVAAIELVSPGNKDRPDTRRAFVAKCASYLTHGIGLIVVDVVTERHANLHDELVTFLGHPEFVFSPATHLYAVAYRPFRRPGADEVEFWRAHLAVGQPMPTLPLMLRNWGCLPVDLEATYTDACRRGRIAPDMH